MTPQVTKLLDEPYKLIHKYCCLKNTNKQQFTTRAAFKFCKPWVDVFPETLSEKN